MVLMLQFHEVWQMWPMMAATTTIKTEHFPSIGFSCPLHLLLWQLLTAFGEKMESYVIDSLRLAYYIERHIFGVYPCRREYH